MLVLTRTVGLKESGIINVVLRRKIIETYLFLLKNYAFCSMSHQQGIFILNYLKENDCFDETDVDTLKSFVREIFDGETNFVYPSGKVASGMAMGQITKIAFELRTIIQKIVDNMDSDDDEEEMTEDMIKRRQEIGQYYKFCKDKIDKIQKVWDTKLGKREF